MHIHLTRRALLIGGAAALGFQPLRASAPVCSLVSEQEEGPFYVDHAAVRRDITEGKPGVPLKLRLAVVDATKCSPLPKVALDIWHCDSVGVYSAYDNQLGPPPGPPPERGDFGPGRGPGGPPPRRSTNATRFFRGIQVTDAKGFVEFETVYPGWYQGRTIHIHVKAHVDGRVCHTGQLFPPEDVSEEIAKLQPYAQHRNVHRTLQTEDHVFTEQHGSTGLLTLERLTPRSNTGGFLATAALALDPEASPEPVGFGPGPRRRG